MSIDVVAAVTAGFKIVVPKLLKQCGYIVFCNSHASDLRREIRNLKNASDRLQHKVDLAGSVGDIIEGDVWTWLNDAEELIKSKNEILEKNNVVSCCFGIVPNPYTRYVLGRGAQNSLPELKDLIEKGKIEQVSYHPAAEQDSEVKVRSATGSSSTVRYVELKSRALVVKRIIAELNDHDKIGVHGMGGVGKTTLLKDVEKRARESGKFDDVVTVFVSQAPNIEGIKSKIRNKLGNLGSNDDDANKKTLLILLDDLWSKLKEVDALENGCKVKVKWVMTSRKQELLVEEMDCHPTISLGVLVEEEVWSFFGELNNNKVEELKSNNAIAALLKKCAGLPVSIEALAKVLEKKGLSSSDLIMEDVLKLGKESIDGSASLELSYNYLGDTDVANLARSIFRIIGLLGTPTVPILTLLKYVVGFGLLAGSSNGNIMEKARRQVNSSLRMLQNASLLLESDDIDYVKIHDVVRDVAASIASRDDLALIFNRKDDLTGWSKDDTPNLNEEAGDAQGLGLLGTNSSNNNIMERARRHVITSSLRMLQDASLLLGSDDSDFVKIHDVVRDVAVSIGSRDDHALVFNRDEDGLRWSKEKLKKSRSVYLPYSVIPNLNEGWECPELSIFIMEGDHILSRQKEGRSHVEVPSSFYKGKAKLKILDLRNAWLSSLSSSIQSDLCNLTTLFLHYCSIESVSVIGKLESLQILSFVGSDLAHLPKEIGNLSKLRMLDLSQCSELKTIDPGTLKRLTRLEELYIKESFDGWEVEGVENPSNSCLAELNCLPRLKTLEVCVPDTDTLPLSLPLGDLVRYKVLIGDRDWSGEYRESRTLKFKEKSKNIMTEEWLQPALQTTQHLYLDGLSGSGESFHEQCKESFKELKHLYLQNCSSVQYIIWSTEWLACSAFTTLESMILDKMYSLEKICHGLINPTSFSKLKVLRVQECHKLINIFNLSLVDSLIELEEVEVSDCKVVREIVTTEEMDDGDARRDEDHKKIMKGCPNNFFGCPIKRSNAMVRAPYVIKLGNLRSLTLRKLPNLRTFFGNEALSEPMETTGHVLLNDQKGALQSSKPKKQLPASRYYKEIPPNTHLELDKLQRLELVDCKHIVHFMGSSMLLKLVNLESLEISRCESLEDIFDLEGVDSRSRFLPMLTELKLWKLPKLVHIWKKKNAMQIKGCRSLTTIEITECNSLVYLSSSSMCDGMENLTEISVEHCEKMEAVFLEKGLVENASSVTTGLRSLKTLVIARCPNMKAFLSDSHQAVRNVFSSSTTFKGMPYWCCGREAAVLADTCSFFNQKVFLPDLERLIISGAGEFEKLWCSDAPAKSYCNLEFLKVEECKNLLTVFPAALIERLQKLKYLLVNHCGKLETVIDLVVDWETKKKPKSLMLPQLQELKLKFLGRLRRIIETDTDYEIVVGFPNLKRVKVLICPELTHLIPAATVTTLLKLEKLKIKQCRELKEVVYGEVSERNKRQDDVISFPRLTSLKMSELESLTCFCSKSYSLDFACLKVLSVRNCINIKMLVKPRSDVGSQDEDQANTGTAAQSFFNKKVRLPNLENLSISHSEIVEELWCEEPPTGSFSKLRQLSIDSCQRLANIIPSFLVNRLQSLDTMYIDGCGSVEDIFNITSTQLVLSVDDSRNNLLERIVALTNLTTLTLGSCVKLGNLCSGLYNLELPSLKKLILHGTTAATTRAILEKVHFPNIEELQVGPISDEVTELWDSEPRHIGSFCKLKILYLWHCEKLIKVIPWFMLKRLQNLEKLVVERCDNLETVCEIGESLDSKHDEEEDMTTSMHAKSCKVDDSTNNRILLPQLNHLSLEKLPNFRHLFHVLHGGQYTLELPSLVDFVLIKSGDKDAVTQKVAFPEELEIKLSEMPNFFGTISSVVSDIVKALQTNQVIIGLHGVMGVYAGQQLEQRVVEGEANLFDQVVECRGDIKFVREELRSVLGMVYGEVEVHERAERVRKTLSNYTRKKRLLLIFPEIEDEGMLEAVGIPVDGGVDPKHFKIILISQDKELLLKMGAKLPMIIPIGFYVENLWRDFDSELRDSQKAIPNISASTRWIIFDSELHDSRVINTDHEAICSFVGPNTIALNNIMAAMRSNYQIIIGIHGSSSWDTYNFSVEVGRLLKQENLIDHVVQTDYRKVDTIQEKLKAAECSSSRSSNEVVDKKRLLMVLTLDEDVDLEAVGTIPQLHHDGRLVDKIILVPEKRQVLQNILGVQQVFEFEGEFLQSDICYRIVDGYVGRSELYKLADECVSPELISLLAKKLKTRGFSEWANAFQRLKESPFEYQERKKVIASL